MRLNTNYDSHLFFLRHDAAYSIVLVGHTSSESAITRIESTTQPSNTSISSILSMRKVLSSFRFRQNARIPRYFFP